MVIVAMSAMRSADGSSSTVARRSSSTLGRICSLMMIGGQRDPLDMAFEDLEIIFGRLRLGALA